MGARFFGGEVHVVESRRCGACCVDDQLHQQHAIVEVERLRYADARGGEAMERIDFGAPPGRLLRLAAEARALAMARACRLFLTLRFSV